MGYLGPVSDERSTASNLKSIVFGQKARKYSSEYLGDSNNVLRAGFGKNLWLLFYTKSRATAMQWGVECHVDPRQSLVNLVPEQVGMTSCLIHSNGAVL